MTKDINQLVRIQQARELADATLDKAAGGPHHHQGGTYLVTSFRKRDDLPVTAGLRRMSPAVMANLAAMGLHEPVSLRTLPGLWWKTNVDAAEIGEAQEWGGRYSTLFMTSERLASIGFEVVNGPYQPWETPDVSRAILKQNPGKYWDATVSNRPLLPVIKGAEPYAGTDNGYSTAELLEALGAGSTIRVYSGPYDTKDAAHYALDVRWESPE